MMRINNRNRKKMKKGAKSEIVRCEKTHQTLYCAICYHSQDSRIAEKMQHGSNNKSAQFTDVELMPAYLWGAQQGLLTRNPTKNLWYHGVKLHIFVQLRPHRLPIPCAVQISKRPVGRKADRSGLRAGHGRTPLCRPRLYRRGVESTSAKRVKHHAHYAA